MKPKSNVKVSKYNKYDISGALLIFILSLLNSLCKEGATLYFSGLKYYNPALSFSTYFHFSLRHILFILK